MRVASIASHVLVAAAAVSLPLCVVYAQQDRRATPVSGRDLVISLEPAHPASGESVHLSLSSNLIDLDHSGITWSRNGKQIAGGDGMTEIDIKTGTLGSKDTIGVDVVGKNTHARTETTVIPTAVDLLYDADSYVPPFYEGRSLPSPGTSLRVQAIAQFRRSDGTALSENEIIYTWKQNDRVLAAVSGRGKSHAILAAPALFDADTVAVSAVSTDGTFSGGASIIVPSVDPTVSLYEDHPLFGVMYHSALPQKAAVNAAETTFIGVPYFATSRSLNDPMLSYEWRVNGASVPVDPRRRGEITINAENSNGSANIDLEITHRKNLFLDAHGLWSVSFNASNVLPGVVDNPFGEPMQ